MNQWELGANTGNRRQARENACDQVAIGFALIGWVAGTTFINQSLSEVKQNQITSIFLSTLKWKPLQLQRITFGKDMANVHAYTIAWKYFCLVNLKLFLYKRCLLQFSDLKVPCTMIFLKSSLTKHV